MKKFVLKVVGVAVIAGTLSVTSNSFAGCGGRARLFVLFPRLRASVQSREFAPVRNLLRGIVVGRAVGGC